MKTAWKFLFVLSIAVTLIMVWSTALAAPPAKSENSVITTSVIDNKLYLTATTFKHGSAYDDSWEGAEKLHTVLNPDGYYISTAVFTPPGSGNFLVTYRITMTAGESSVKWTATEGVSLEVTVDPQTETIRVKVGRIEFKT